jgi:hypothetical protein
LVVLGKYLGWVILKNSCLAEPIDPKLEGENREAVRANEDSPVRMKCSSKGGRPAARLVWVVSLDREGRRISSYLNNASEILQEIGGNCCLLTLIMFFSFTHPWPKNLWSSRSGNNRRGVKRSLQDYKWIRVSNEFKEF